MAGYAAAAAPEGRPHRVLQSFAVACNKGGVGKSTTLAQVATQFAADNPNVNVLILDFTITGNVSSLLFSSEGFGQVKSTAVFLDNLSQFSENCKKKESWWPSRQWGREQSFEWTDSVTRAQDIQPSSRPNLYVTRGGREIKQVLKIENWKDMVKAWCRSGYAEIDTTVEPQWVVFMDTDQQVGSNQAQFALACAERIIAPLELDELDFGRLFEEDEDDPGLFFILRQLDEEAQADESLPQPGKFHRLIFTKLQVGGTANPTDLDIPFKVPKAEVETIQRLGDRLLGLKNDGSIPASTFSNPEIADADFTRYYFTALPKFAVTPLSVSKMYALPFADLETSGGPGAAVKLPAGLPSSRPQKQDGFTNSVVSEIKEKFKFLCSRLLD